MGKTLVSNASQLARLLKKKYEKRLTTNPLQTIMGSIYGTLDSKKINITFKGNEYLIISTTSNSREVLDELRPILTEIMGDSEPICSYDLQREGMEEQDFMPTIEWDVKNPEGRLKEIINGGAFFDGAKIHNLKLYNSKKVENCLENEQEDRIKKTRIYGIDPGCVKAEEINNLSEIDLFFNIDGMGSHIFGCQLGMKHGNIPEVDLTEEEYALEYMIYQTTKFGVELPEPAIDKHITATPSYYAWYNFYANHFKEVLTDEEWQAFQEAKRNGQDISMFMPNGSWTDLLEEAVQKKLK